MPLWSFQAIRDGIPETNHDKYVLKMKCEDVLPTEGGSSNLQSQGKLPWRGRSHRISV